MDGTLVSLKVKCTEFSRRQERLPSWLGPVTKGCFGAKAVASSSVRYRDAQVLHRVRALFVDGRVVGVLGGAQAIIVQLQFPGLVIIGYCIDGCPVPSRPWAANTSMPPGKPPRRRASVANTADTAPRSICVTPGGLGVFEGAAVTTLHWAGVPLPMALSATLLFRGLSFWAPMLPGLLVARTVLCVKPPG